MSLPESGRSTRKRLSSERDKFHPSLRGGSPSQVWVIVRSVTRVQ
jgi:hypothetical protein